MTQKAHSWNAQELRAITRWYGAVAHDPSLPGDEAIVSAIDPMSTNGGTLRTLQSLLDGNTEPQEAAKDLASSILAAEAPTNSWGWMLVAVCRASEFQDQPRLLKLADLTNELSKLPHALPHHPYLPDVRSPDDLKFAELPGFGLTLRESLNGQFEPSSPSILQPLISFRPNAILQRSDRCDHTSTQRCSRPMAQHQRFYSRHHTLRLHRSAAPIPRFRLDGTCRHCSCTRK